MEKENIMISHFIIGRILRIDTRNIIPKLEFWYLITYFAAFNEQKFIMSHVLSTQANTQ